MNKGNLWVVCNVQIQREGTTFVIETWLQENMNKLVELEVFNDSLWIEGAELKNSRFLQFNYFGIG